MYIYVCKSPVPTGPISISRLGKNAESLYYNRSNFQGKTNLGVSTVSFFSNMKITKQVGTVATFAIFHNLMKRKLLFVFCKWKTEVCFPWSANGNRRLLFQQKCTHVSVHAMAYLFLHIDNN